MYLLIVHLTTGVALYFGPFYSHPRAQVFADAAERQLKNIERWWITSLIDPHQPELTQ